jgi:hypothetical protein
LWIRAFFASHDTVDQRPVALARSRSPILFEKGNCELHCIYYLDHVDPFEKRKWFDDSAVHPNTAWSGKLNAYVLVPVLAMVKLGRPEPGMVP